MLIPLQHSQLAQLTKKLASMTDNHKKGANMAISNSKVSLTNAKPLEQLAQVNDNR